MSGAAVRLVKDHLAALAAQPWGHAVAGVCEHAGWWSVALQPIEAKGSAAYDLIGSDVDPASMTVTRTE